MGLDVARVSYKERRIAMLVVAGFVFLFAVLLWFMDQCICDASVDFSMAARVMVILASLLVGINTLFHLDLLG